MSESRKIGLIAVIGGTGALGGGLARRWAADGCAVVLGSRDGQKAEAAARKLAESLPGGDVRGMENSAAALAADLVVLTVPFPQQEPVLKSIAAGLEGKILVDATVPLVPPRVGRVQLPPEGAAAIRAQRLVPAARVVSAFQNVAADRLAGSGTVDCDVLVSGDDPEARETVVTLAARAGLRAWHAGPLQNAAAAEALTSVLIFLNKRYGEGHAGLRITGLDGA
ncbi:MAG: NADPH-dependent F420 reductase [Chromatiales bacterium]|nr:NADPH-dependent F420 reductase [Chromatiales bacterium]